MSSQSFLIVTLLFSIVTLINTVPVTNVDDIGANNLTSVPDSININGSLTVLDSTTVPTIDLTTISSSNSSLVNETRDGRSNEELIMSKQESIKNDSKESIIRLERDDNGSGIINSTSTKQPNEQTSTNSPISEISLESNSTITEGLIELSSSSTSSVSSTVDDLSSVNSTKSSTADEIIVNGTSLIAPRIGRSQSDIVEDELNSNLNDTLLVLTTLSSILNQSSTNDSLSAV